MVFIKKREQFLKDNNVSDEDWNAAEIDWDTLVSIANDYEQNKQNLLQAASFIANSVQRLTKTHSVRWRVKDTEHLIEKIIRKRKDKAEKYLDINADNYFHKVTDLIGVRIIHLFKDDVFDVIEELDKLWQPAEPVIAYVRSGDFDELLNKYIDKGWEVEEHKAGYRSIHYIASTKPMNRNIFVEIQVRTIFEEGWSEIDHTVRYPNFSNNVMVSYFLTIFNRLSGSADEMGTYAKQLAEHLSLIQGQRDNIEADYNHKLLSLQESLDELEQLRLKDGDSQRIIKKLQNEVSELKQPNCHLNSFIGSETLRSAFVSSGILQSEALRNAIDANSLNAWFGHMPSALNLMGTDTTIASASIRNALKPTIKKQLAGNENNVKKKDND